MLCRTSRILVFFLAAWPLLMPPCVCICGLVRGGRDCRQGPKCQCLAHQADCCSSENDRCDGHCGRACGVCPGGSTESPCPLACPLTIPTMSDSQMAWTRSATLGLASLSCAQCDGMGLVRGTLGKDAPCPCVLRKIFRVCWNRYRFGQLEQIERGAPIVRMGGLGKRAQRQPGGFSFALESYLADFVLIAKRTLSDDEFQFFTIAYLSGMDWKRVHGSLNIPRTNFLRTCYSLESRLGRAFRETAPFPIFPLDEYFSRPAPGKRTVAFPGTRPARYQPIRPPLAKLPWVKMAV